eukprot:UC4_evm1s210
MINGTRLEPQVKTLVDAINSLRTSGPPYLSVTLSVPVPCALREDQNNAILYSNPNDTMFLKSDEQIYDNGELVKKSGFSTGDFSFGFAESKTDIYDGSINARPGFTTQDRSHGFVASVETDAEIYDSDVSARPGFMVQDLSHGFVQSTDTDVYDSYMSVRPGFSNQDLSHGFHMSSDTANYDSAPEIRKGFTVDDNAHNFKPSTDNDYYASGSQCRPGFQSADAGSSWLHGELSRSEAESIVTKQYSGRLD